MRWKMMLCMTVGGALVAAGVLAIEEYSADWRERTDNLSVICRTQAARRAPEIIRRCDRMPREVLREIGIDRDLDPFRKGWPPHPIVRSAKPEWPD